MDKPTKALIAGLVLGGLVYGVTEYRLKALSSELYRLDQECQKEQSKIRNQNTGVDFVLICDPAQLADQTGPTLQGQIGVTFTKMWWWLNLPPVGPIIAVVLAIPWAWYFLLRRLREFRDVIAGQN